MRFLLLTASILWASIGWAQNGRDCATAASVSDKAICSNAFYCCSMWRTHSCVPR